LWLCKKKPPVVTIMGHVDHGKTSLLDYIRKTKLTTKEFGEITQAIGAYQIEFKEEKITFIDTPGHAAFAQMRARGASVADIVVLVVAATDGVMPQTKESIKIIKEAGIPFIVAINKIDLPEAEPERIKGQLTENEVFVEGYGGNVVAVPISAKTGQGIDQLLEMILLTADLEELKADPAGVLEAVIIEAKSDHFCGPTASLIIKNGSLSKGQQIFADGVEAKIKMLKNEWGKSVEKVFPGDPVLVLGFTSLPKVGVKVTPSKEGQGATFEEKGFSKSVQETGKEKFRIILKADVSGSLEAILGCLPQEVSVIGQGVGEVNDSDVLLAKTLKAEIYTFNLEPDAETRKLAQTEKVKIKNFNIIYDLLKELEERILKILEPNIDRKILGKAEILATFEMKGEKIAGAKVLEGKINKSQPVILQRGEKELGQVKIVSLKQQRQDINEAVVGTEFGAVFSGKVDFSSGDMILSFSLEEK
ncbi:MAG: translation initiation factor IF-2, partial [Patescibacteria group bacterium]|nr:translation initiation factor IF-2 [Patescibacteria group bacterium]